MRISRKEFRGSRELMSAPKRLSGSQIDHIRKRGRAQVNVDSLKVNVNKRLLLSIDYKIVESATNNFNESIKLGEGGFRCVYKAKLEDNYYIVVHRVEVGVQDAHLEFEVNRMLKPEKWQPTLDAEGKVMGFRRVLMLIRDGVQISHLFL